MKQKSREREGIALAECVIIWVFVFMLAGFPLVALVRACVMIWCIAMGWVLVGRISVLYAWHQQLACLSHSLLLFDISAACLVEPKHGMVALISVLGKVLII